MQPIQPNQKKMFSAAGQTVQSQCRYASSGVHIYACVRSCCVLVVWWDDAGGPWPWWWWS